MYSIFYVKQAIVQALEKVCNYLPAKYSKQCDDFVDLYAVQIIELLLKELSAKEVCIELGLCSKTLKALVSEAAVILGGTSGAHLTLDQSFVEVHKHSYLLIQTFNE